MKSWSSILAAPVLCAGLLIGIAAQKASLLKPADAEPYHARVKAAVDAIPMNLGLWSGVQVDLPPAAVNLLRPNAILSRHYRDNRRYEYGPTGARRRRSGMVAQLLIVQCRDSRDMVGHYPRNCYVNSGEDLREERERTWQVGDVSITGTEYMFDMAGGRRRCVYNFLIVPGADGGQIVPDIEGVNRAAEDYQRRYLGAAQFQFVLSGDAAEAPRAERDRAFRSLMGEIVDVIKVMQSADLNVD